MEIKSRKGRTKKINFKTIMKAFLGIDQKKEQRMLLNSICLDHCLNPQQVKEDIKNQGFENLTIKEIINFINLNY